MARGTERNRVTHGARFESVSPPIVVQKYGGSSVATPAHLGRVADQVLQRRATGVRMVVVVSAMAETTDRLMAMARELADEPDRRELDMLVTAGERISMALLALAIRARGVEAVSLTGSQSGILTTASHSRARIMEVRPFRIQDELERDRVVIVAGYQGVSYQREVTALGRGGSDTTAVALTAALGAEVCEICSDVDGVWSADPRQVPRAQRIDRLDWDLMHEMAASGARVLHAEAVRHARKRGIAIYARQTGGQGSGTWVRRDLDVSREAVAVTRRRRVVRLSFGMDQAESTFDWCERCGGSWVRLDLEDRGGRAVLSLDDAVSEVAVPPGVDATMASTVTGVGHVFVDRPMATVEARQALEAASIPVTNAWCTGPAAHFVVPLEASTRASCVLHEHLGLDVGRP